MSNFKNGIQISAIKVYECLPFGEYSYDQLKKLIQKQFKLDDKQVEGRIGSLKKMGYLTSPKRAVYVKSANQNKPEFKEQVKRAQTKVRKIEAINEVGLIRKFWRWIY